MILDTWYMIQDDDYDDDDEDDDDDESWEHKVDFMEPVSRT